MFPYFLSGFIQELRDFLELPNPAPMSVEEAIALQRQGLPEW